MILKRGKYTSASYTKKLQGIFDDYAILSPSTDKHCLISSVFMGVKKKKKINEDVKNYIKKYQIKNVVSTLENLAENLCEHFQINILAITARDFEEVLFKCKGQTENTELIKILIFGAHSYALLDKKYGVKSDIINEYRKPELIEEVKEEKNKYEDYEFATYDFETCDDENKNAHPYALGFKTKKRYKAFYKNKIEANISLAFLEHLRKRNKNEPNLIIYAHNGGKFDHWIILKDLLESKCGYIENIIIQNGRIINMPVKIGDHHYIFRDSYCFITSSLDKACDDFETKTKKLKGDVDHNKINIVNCITPEIKEYTREYLKNDCLCLYEMIDNFNDIILKRFNFTLKEVITNAGIARKCYLKEFYNQEETPLYTLNEKIDHQIRKYYFGGRNECMEKLGRMKKGKYYYYDFTSLYPSCMVKELYPYGKMNIIKTPKKYKNKFNKKWFGFVKCMVKHSKEMLENRTVVPYHGIIKDSKLVFQYLEEPQEIVLTTEEIKYSIINNCGYEYEFLEVYNYKNKSVYFKKIINSIFDMKNQAKKEGKNAMYNISKIILNSVYGFWGIKLDDRDQINIKKQKNPKKSYCNVIKYLESKTLQDYSRIGDYDVFRYTGKIKSNCANVGIAFFTSAYARMKLHKVIMEVKNKGGKVYYMDTDSIITDYCIEDDLELSQKYMKNGGKDLGELTNETDEYKGFYKEIIILGNKFYALKNKKLKKKKLRIILKAKGINIKAKYNKKRIDEKLKKNNEKKRTIIKKELNNYEDK